MKKLLTAALLVASGNVLALDLAISPLLLVKAERCTAVPAEETPGRTEVECTLHNYTQATLGTLFRLVAITADGKEVKPSTNVGELPATTSRQYRIVVANGSDVGVRVELRERGLFGRD